ncbi:MAG: TIGR04211 family SH3 domain-containing protein [Desulfobulbaceae bacterium]|nr:TIGR04211 family SH3 domain-containing protein [Desulfobulbaceae bacterium]
MTSFSILLKRTASHFSSWALFTFLVSLIIHTFYLSGLLYAATLYVQPSSDVVVRTGQGTDYKIIAMVTDGTPVEFLEQGDGYTKVRLANGKEGWMLKRFLSQEPPLEDVIASLQAEKNAWKQREGELLDKFQKTSSSLESITKDRDGVVAELDQLRANYKKRVTQENESLLAELESLKFENTTLKRNIAVKWFLAGGGVLLLGILMGKMSGRSKNKRSTLLGS